MGGAAPDGILRRLVPFFGGRRERERERELLIAESAERESLCEMSAAWTEDGGEGPGARAAARGRKRRRSWLLLSYLVTSVCILLATL